MAESAAHRAWTAENTVYVPLRLNKRTDADILTAIDGKQKQTEIKRLVRVALKVEKENEHEEV